MRKAILTLTILLLLAVGITVFLVKTAPLPNKTLNGFDRTIIADILTPLSNMPTGDSIYTLSGATATQLFFSTADPGTFISTDYRLQHRRTIKLQLSKGLRDSLQAYFYSSADSPFIHIYGYNMPAIITIPMLKGVASVYRLSAGGFSKAVPLAHDQFVLRKLDRKIADQQFIKVNTTIHNIITEKDLSVQHQDGGMSTDGQLHYDATTGQLTYLYYYSNQFFSFDTAFKLLRTGHTIDTFASSRFQLSATDASKKHVFTSQGPDQMINRSSCVYNGRLFVQSLLKGDHEKEGDFRNNTPVDMYDLSDGKYLGSFYIPLSKSNDVRRIHIYHHTLIVYCKTAFYAFSLHY
jgi:hypothetical protein